MMMICNSIFAFHVWWQEVLRVLPADETPCRRLSWQEGMGDDNWQKGIEGRSGLSGLEPMCYGSAFSGGRQVSRDGPCHGQQRPDCCHGHWVPLHAGLHGQRCFCLGLLGHHRPDNTRMTLNISRKRHYFFNFPVTGNVRFWWRIVSTFSPSSQRHEVPMSMSTRSW